MGEANGSWKIDSPFATPRGEDPDPLGEVIDWLGYADLGNDLADVGEVAASSCGGGARELNNGKSSECTARSGSDAADSSGGQPAGDQPPLFAGRQSPLAGAKPLTAYCGIGSDADAKKAPVVEPEEEEWDARQQQTGAAGRLVVYEAGDSPRDDFHLRGGAGRRIMVTAVTEGSKASQAGVKAGDVLVSVGGKKDFKAKSADAVMAGLKAPVMLVFMGFVGKLQAEVRLNYKQKACGLSSQHQVVFGRPEAPVKVVDEVIFQPGAATLFLATTPTSQRPPSLRSGDLTRSHGSASSSRGPALGDDVCDMEDCEGESLGVDIMEGPAVLEDDSPEPLAAVYELRGHEARHLVSRALVKAQLASPSSAQSAWESPGRTFRDHAQAPRAVNPTPSLLSGRGTPTTPSRQATATSPATGSPSGGWLV